MANGVLDDLELERQRRNQALSQSLAAPSITAPVPITPAPSPSLSVPQTTGPSLESALSTAGPETPSTGGLGGLPAVAAQAIPTEALGAAGPAVSGAVLGGTTAGVPGAIIGGAAGLLGGVFGSLAEEEERKRQATLKAAETRFQASQTAATQGVARQQQAIQNLIQGIQSGLR